MAALSRLCIHFTHARSHHALGEGRFERSSHLQRPTQAYNHARVVSERREVLSQDGRSFRACVLRRVAAPRHELHQIFVKSK